MDRLFLSVLLAACGCTQESPATLPLPPGGSIPHELTPCDDRRELLDLLLVIDDSCSMSEEHASLGAELPSLLRSLLTGDANLDGEPDFRAIDSIQVGVVSTDMGTGGQRVPTCAEPDFGGDGILRTTGNTGIGGCAPDHPTFHSFEPDGLDDPGFGHDLSCVASLGTGGCGFEQQLEAGLKAISPANSSLYFHRDTSGHLYGANAGFVREGSILAIVILSDEEDCSVRDVELFNPGSTRYPGDLNLRCTQFPEAVHPTSRYVEGFLARRRNAPWRLVYGVIAGVPARLIEGSATLEQILDDPEMQETVDPMMPTRLRPRCNVPGRGLAFPARRMVEVGRGLDAHGAQVVITSVCQSSFAQPIETIVEAIGRATLPRCSP